MSTTLYHDFLAGYGRQDARHNLVTQTNDGLYSSPFLRSNVKEGRCFSRIAFWLTKCKFTRLQKKAEKLHRRLDPLKEQLATLKETRPHYSSQRSTGEEALSSLQLARRRMREYKEAMAKYQEECLPLQTQIDKFDSRLKKLHNKFERVRVHNNKLINWVMKFEYRSCLHYWDGVKSTADYPDIPFTMEQAELKTNVLLFHPELPEVT